MATKSDKTQARNEALETEASKALRDYLCALFTGGGDAAKSRLFTSIHQWMEKAKAEEFPDTRTGHWLHAFRDQYNGSFEDFIADTHVLLMTTLLERGSQTLTFHIRNAFLDSAAFRRQ